MHKKTRFLQKYIKTNQWKNSPFKSGKVPLDIWHTELLGHQMLKSDIAFQLPNDEIFQGKGKKPANWVIIYQSHPFQKSLSLKKTAWPLGPGIFGKFHPHPNLWYGFMNLIPYVTTGPARKKNTPVASVLSDDLWLSSQRTDLHLFSSRAAMVQWHGEKESCVAAAYIIGGISYIYTRNLCASILYVCYV